MEPDWSELGCAFQSGYDSGLLWRDKLVPVREQTDREKVYLERKGWEWDEEEYVWYKEQGSSQGR